MCARKIIWPVAILIFLWPLFINGCDGAPGDGGRDTAALPGGDAVRGLGAGEADLSIYDNIPLEAGQIDVSDNLPGMEKNQLVQPGADGFWHAVTPKKKISSWISLTLDRPRPVALVRLLPRRGLPAQMWRGYTAALQASGDRQDWQTIAILGIIPWPPAEDWLNFQVLASGSYPYYR